MEARGPSAVRGLFQAPGAPCFLRHCRPGATGVRTRRITGRGLLGRTGAGEGSLRGLHLLRGAGMALSHQVILHPEEAALDLTCHRTTSLREEEVTTTTSSTTPEDTLHPDTPPTTRVLPGHLHLTVRRMAEGRECLMWKTITHLQCLRILGLT